MSQVQFGVSLAPRIEDLDTIVKLATAADDAGLDLLAIQDHPYVAEFVDTFSLIGHLLARTTRITVFPDVANLPLRPPAMLAKAAATLDLLSGGLSVSAVALPWTQSRRWVVLFARAGTPCPRLRRVSRSSERCGDPEKLPTPAATTSASTESRPACAGARYRDLARLHWPASPRVDRPCRRRLGGPYPELPNL